MSYSTQEISAAAGQPVELYRFVLGQLVWTVTSGREAITYQVESYQPAVIRRSAVEQSPEFARNGIDLECARDFAVAQLFAAARPNGVVSLTVSFMVVLLDSSRILVLSSTMQETIIRLMSRKFVTRENMPVTIFSTWLKRLPGPTNEKFAASVR